MFYLCYSQQYTKQKPWFRPIAYHELWVVSGCLPLVIVTRFTLTAPVILFLIVVLLVCPIWWWRKKNNRPNNDMSERLYFMYRLQFEWEFDTGMVFKVRNIGIDNLTKFQTSLDREWRHFQPQQPSNNHVKFLFRTLSLYSGGFSEWEHCSRAIWSKICRVDNVNISQSFLQILSLELIFVSIFVSIYVSSFGRFS